MGVCECGVLLHLTAPPSSSPSPLLSAKDPPSCFLVLSFHFSLRFAHALGFPGKPCDVEARVSGLFHWTSWSQGAPSCCRLTSLRQRGAPWRFSTCASAGGGVGSFQDGAVRNCAAVNTGVLCCAVHVPQGHVIPWISGPNPVGSGGTESDTISILGQLVLGPPRSWGSPVAVHGVTPASCVRVTGSL